MGRHSALPPMNSNALTAMRLPMLSNAPQFMPRCAPRVAIIREVLVTRAGKNAPECLRSSATISQFKDQCRSVPRFLNKTVKISHTDPCEGTQAKLSFYSKQEL